MKILKKIAQVSSSVIRVAIGIGGAALVFLALKEGTKRDSSKGPKSGTQK